MFIIPPNSLPLSISISELDAELEILAVQLLENPEQEPSPQDAHMAQRGSSAYFRETSGIAHLCVSR